jgi:Tol biopolymer transport system component
LRGGDVWLLDLHTGRSRRLTHTGAGIYPVAWSSDGTRLLAANPATHNGRLWAVDVRTGRARDLTGWVGDLFPQGLSRNGKTILAAIGCGGTISPFGIVETLPFAGGRAHVIVRGPCRASWND